MDGSAPRPGERDEPDEPPTDAFLLSASTDRDWYARESSKARWGYQLLELAQVVLGAAVPLTIALHTGTAAPAVFGALVVVVGGVRSIFQWHDNWLTFADTVVALDGEIALYRAGAAPYDGLSPGPLLVANVQLIKRAETQQWRSRRQSRDSKAAQNPAAEA